MSWNDVLGKYWADRDDPRNLKLEKNKFKLSLDFCHVLT
jgi:hypothetical protein